MGPKWWKKIALYLSVNVFSRKVLIGDTIFTSPCGDGTAILSGLPSHTKVYPFAGQRKYLHYSVILIPWVLLRPRDVESTTPRPAVKRSTTELILPLLKWCYGILNILLFSLSCPFFYYALRILCGNFQKQVEVLSSTGTVFHFSPFVSVTNPCRIC